MGSALCGALGCHRERDHGVYLSGLNVHGPEAFESADQGIRRLARLLGPDAAVDEWWDGVLSDMSADNRGALPSVGSD